MAGHPAGGRSRLTHSARGLPWVALRAYEVEGDTFRTDLFIDSLGCQADSVSIATYLWRTDGDRIWFSTDGDVCPARALLFESQEWDRLP